MEADRHGWRRLSTRLQLGPSNVLNFFRDILSMTSVFCIIMISTVIYQIALSNSELCKKWDRAVGDIRIYIILLICICILYIFRHYIKRCNVAFKLSGPPAIPIIGNVNLILGENLIHRLTYEALTYGSLFRVWVFMIPYVVVLEPHHIQKILGSTKHVGKPIYYKLLNTFVGKGLITSDVEPWRIHRKVIQPALHVSMLEKFAVLFVESAEHLVDNLSKRCNENVNITSFINDATYDLLTESILGTTAEWRKGNQSYNNTDKLFRKCQMLFFHRLSRPWLLFNWTYQMTKEGKTNTKHEKNFIEACRKAMKQKREKIVNIDTNSELLNDQKISLLEYLLEMQEKNPYFTDEDIINECCTFMLAGQDSASTTIAMTLALLANNPDWQRKCVDEINEVFGDGPISMTMNTNRELKYLEMCIKEALRLYPPVPLFARILGEDVKIGKQVIPAGYGVIILPYTTHRIPHLFPDPEVFNPERFSSENSNQIHPYAYLPFSAGPRNCIGYKFAMLEMKTMIGAILRRYHLEPVDGKNIIKPKYRLTLRAEGGLWIKITSRVKSYYAKRLAREFTIALR